MAAPVLAVMTHHGEVVMEEMRSEPVHKHRQPVFLLFVQRGIKRRSCIRDCLKILAPRHRVFAALPDTINEASICGLVFEFLMSIHGALASRAQRGFNGRAE